MITKERLEELIYNEQTIWVVYDEERIEHIKLITKMFGVSVDEYNQINKCEPILYSNFCGVFKDICPLKDCFETKEDAEEYAEFGNITRTERLELNNYETFLKSNTGTMFYLNACEHLLHKVRHSVDDENPDWRIEVCVFYNDLEESSEVLYSKPLTREHYNEARRLCIKLFKGEEV